MNIPLPIKHAAMIVGGSCLTQAAINDLFYNQTGTAAQITAIAIPIFYVLKSVFEAKRGALPKLNPILISYIVVALVVILGNAYSLATVKGVCQFYKTCSNGQSDSVETCMSIHNQCRKEVTEAGWISAKIEKFDRSKYNKARYWRSAAFDASGECVRLKTQAAANLCTRMLEPGMDFIETENCYPIRRLRRESLDRVIQLQQELFSLTQCNPDIQNNLYFRTFEPVGAFLYENLMPILALSFCGLWHYTEYQRDQHARRN